MQMITHGISTGALFILAGFIYERIHTRDITNMGGFWKSMPFLGACALVFAMASLGLPGLGNFVAEFLTLVGAWQATHKLTIIATIGLVAATIYSLRILQKVFYGQQSGSVSLVDLSLRERLVMVILVVSIIWLGLFPQPVLNTSQPAVKTIIEKPHSSNATTAPQTNPFQSVINKPALINHE
jgi:NADH-quinone oxidoreductase subunit M